MNLEEYKQKFSEDDAVGWDMIDDKLKEIYGDQNPKHWKPVLPVSAGGNDPLDGVSIYESEKEQKHLHLVSYGMSQLYYDEEMVGREYSKWGYEMTFRFVGEEDPMWIINLMNNIARNTYRTRNTFSNGHVLPAGEPICQGADTEMTALMFGFDPELGVMETPHGLVEFVQIFGITTAELDYLADGFSSEKCDDFLEKMKVKNPLLLTDLKRESIV